MNVKALVYGAAAGAAGSAALNATTYADMAIRARPPSEVPTRVVRKVAHWMGVRHLGRNRAKGLSMLLGYTDGVSAGILLGVLRPRLRTVPWYAAGAGLAAITLLLSEGGAAAMGKTDPRRWGVSGWLAGIVPRVFYGCVTTLVYDALTE